MKYRRPNRWPISSCATASTVAGGAAPRASFTTAAQGGKEVNIYLTRVPFPHRTGN